MMFRLPTIAMRPPRPNVTQRSNGLNHVRSAITGYHHYSSGSHFTSSSSQHQEQAAVVAEEETLISANEIFGNLFKCTTLLDGYMKEEPEVLPKVVSQDQGIGIKKAADWQSGPSLMDLNRDEETASNTMTDVPTFAETPNKNELYWQKVPHWHNVSEKQFMEKKWQVRHPTLTTIPSLETSSIFLLITLIDCECCSRQGEALAVSHFCIARNNRPKTRRSFQAYPDPRGLH